MGATVFYLATVNATTIYQFKGKDTEIKKYALCLGNISGDFSAYNMKKTGLNGCVCNFSVDYCHQFKRKTETISWIAESQECVLPRVGIKGCWFVNHESISWSHKPKISKSSIFCECFFPKYGNLKIISTDDLGVAST